MAKAVIILSGGIKKDKSGRWRSTDLTQEDNELSAPGGYLRVLAGKILFESGKYDFIVAMSGRGYDVKNDEERRPAIWEIVKGELIALGVSEEKIIAEKESNTTFEQINALGNIIGENSLNEIAVISNRSHLPRVQAMMEKEKALGDSLEQGKIKLLSAEEILIESDKDKWRATIEQDYGSEWMHQRMALELKGAADFKAGKYNIKK